MTDGDPLHVIFPVDEEHPLSPFVMSMSIARNDIEHALAEAEKQAKADEPTYAYFVRLAAGHLYEALEALEFWKHERPILTFLRGLPEPGPRALRAVNSARQQIGHRAMLHARNSTFHYASPDPKYDSVSTLRDVMEALADKPVSILIDREEERVRLSFADEVATALAFWKHHHADSNTLRKQFLQTRETAAAFTTLIDVAVVAYLQAAGVDF